MKHILTEWERNGYDDSDFYVTYYDDESCIVRQYEIGSTRYAGGIQYPEDSKILDDPKILEMAIRWLSGAIFLELRTAEHRDVTEPQPSALTRGTILQLTRDVRRKGGKPGIPTGTVGEVFEHQAFGQLYRNGYNKPDRLNTRVNLRLFDGSFAWVALKACRLAREPMSDHELENRAGQLAQQCGFSRALNPRCAWDTHNYAAALRDKNTPATTLSVLYPPS